MNCIASEIQRVGQVAGVNAPLLAALVQEETEKQVLAREAVRTGLPPEGVELLFSWSPGDPYGFERALGLCLGFHTDTQVESLSYVLSNLKQVVRRISFDRRLRLLQEQSVNVVDEHGEVFTGTVDVTFNFTLDVTSKAPKDVDGFLLKRKFWQPRIRRYCWTIPQIIQIKGRAIYVSDEAWHDGP